MLKLEEFMKNLNSKNTYIELVSEIIESI